MDIPEQIAGKSWAKMVEIDNKQKKGAGSRSGVANRWAKGGSDDEIKKLTNEQKQVVDLVKTQWTDDEKMLVIKYLRKNMGIFLCHES